MSKVREERTGWRDEYISRKHRSWGYNCPAVDIDFLLVEYDQNVPRAIIEYKAKEVTPEIITNSAIQTLSNLGDMAGIPAFCVQYSEESVLYHVIPLNGIAKQIFKRGPKTIDETRYIKFLHYLRSDWIPE